MTNKKNNQDKHTTKYGEFVPSYFTWQSPEIQKERANELNNMTKKDKKFKKASY